MNWFWISIGALGGLFYLVVREKRRVLKVSARSGRAPVKTETERDRVEAVLASGDVDAMASTLSGTHNPLLRDALLSHLVAHYYRKRSGPDERKTFYALASQHVEEAPNILDALAESEKGRPDRVDTFKMLAIAMNEDERYDEAIEICQQALSLGLENGTKTGFEGRISRLQKNREATG